MAHQHQHLPHPQLPQEQLIRTVDKTEAHKIICKADKTAAYKVAPAVGKLDKPVLALATPNDLTQVWTKQGSPKFSLIDGATVTDRAPVKIMKHSNVQGTEVKLVNYEPNMKPISDEELLWTEISEGFGGGFKAVFCAAGNGLCLTLLELKEGSPLVLEKWHDGKDDRQLWKFTSPIC